MAAIEREFLDLESTPGGWHALFQRLHQISRLNAGSQLQAKSPRNITRNRYRDVLPIDETRVTLMDDDNDYINANYVKVEEVNRTYILTQGPLQHTLAHFWQMVWEQRTAGIIMLNKCMERGMNKCTKYWPALGENPMLFNDRYLVESTKCDEEESYRLTHLTLQNLEEARTVLHFHYLRWPDFGVPQTPNIFLEYLLAVRSSGVLEPNVGPSLVHCSAGIGRSGTFCVVDVSLAKLEETRNLDSLNVQELLLDMRKQRFGLIQTPDQLRFSYIAILQAAYNNLGLENNLQRLSEEMRDSESEEEELIPTESSEEDDEDQESRKYPHLNREYGVPYDEDVPPPIPPRPPDILPQGAPPPPPTSLPPGPPTIHYHEGGPPVSKDEPREDSEPVTVVPRSYENGEVSGSASEGEEEPPPIPRRGKSLSPDMKSNEMMNTAGMELINGSADHFLGEGRGGGASLSPLLNKNGATNDRGEEGKEDGPLHSPGKPHVKGHGKEVEVEEALISELDQLNQMISEHERRAITTHPGTKIGLSQDEAVLSSELRRRQQRDDRKDRIAAQVNSMKAKDRHHQEMMGGGTEVITSDLSVPWLIFGFAVMVGYCMYYLFS